MKNFILQKHVRNAGLIALTIILLGCNTNKKAIDTIQDIAPSYIDSIFFNFTAIEITSKDLLSAINQLKKESSNYQPFVEFDDYLAFIFFGTQTIDETQFFILTISRKYMDVFSFPGADDVYPFNEYRYPNIPSIMGITYLDEIPIIFSSRLESFVNYNNSKNVKLLKLTEEFRDLTAYGYKSSETNEWQYYLMPSVTAYYEIVENELVFSRYHYYDGSLYH